MTWREATLVKILLLVARMFADDSELRVELKNLANHISAGAGKPGNDDRAVA